MNIIMAPTGVPTLRPEDRQHIINLVGGDTLRLYGNYMVDDAEPVTPDNSEIKFIILDQLMSLIPIWTGTWRDGIEPVPETPGLIEVRIPDSISSSLRRGSYVFSTLVISKRTQVKTTMYQGTLLIDYAPTSPTHDVPYRNPRWETQFD